MHFYKNFKNYAKKKSNSRIQNLNLLHVNKENIKRCEEAIVEENRLIHERTVELERAKVELAMLSKEVDNTRRKLQHKTERLKTLQLQTHEASNQIKSKQQNLKTKVAFSISNITANKRKLNPSRIDLPLKAKSVRRQESYEALKVIHGGKDDNTPVLNGIIETLTGKFKHDQVTNSILSRNNPLSRSLARKSIDT